jgi:hypothetical protein
MVGKAGPRFHHRGDDNENTRVAVVGKAGPGVVWVWTLVVGGGEAIEDGTQGSDCFREKVGTSYAPGGSPTEQMRFESSKSAIAPLHGIG